MRFHILLLWLILLLAECASGATLTVRKDGTGDYMVIQQALDVAADGDTVLIGPGEYTESTMVRLPGWAYDIESFAHLRSDDVTLIGAGDDVTVIGPTSYQGSAGTYSPKGVTYDVGRKSIHISDLSVRNCYEGVYALGTIFIDGCYLRDNALGLTWGFGGPGGWVRDSIFEVSAPIFEPMAFDIGTGGLGSNTELARCRFSHAAIIRSAQGVVIRNCELTGLNLYSGTTTYIYDSRSTGGGIGITQSLGGGTYCEITNCELAGTSAALVVGGTAPGGRFVVENTRLEGGSRGVFVSGDGAGPCVIHNCDFVKGSGPIVKCDVSSVAVTHDLRNNYWGTTNEADIQAWIIDHSDHPNYGATVLYSPFAGQSVPAEATSWGDLKSLFR